MLRRFVLLLVLMLATVANSSGQVRLRLRATVIEADDFGNLRPEWQGDFSNITGCMGGGGSTTVYKVINLDNSGSGSLRVGAAMSDVCIVFEISGDLVLSSPIAISGTNVTIAGQTAPAPGVRLRGYGFDVGTYPFTAALNVVIQHVIIAPGGGTCNDAIVIYSPRVAVDHVSIFWNTDEGIHVTNGWNGSGVDPSDTLLWRNFHGEPLGSYSGICSPQGADGGHGVLLYSYANHVMVGQSVMASVHARHPMTIARNMAVAFNNLYYNWQHPSGFDFQNQDNGTDTGTDPAAAWFFSAVGNRFIPGPDTSSTNLFFYYAGYGTGGGANEIYRSDNTADATSPHYADFTEEVNQLGYNPNVGSPPPEAPTTNITAIASTAVEAYVLPRAGARPLARDAIGTRIAAALTARTGGFIEDESDVGGYPTFTGTTQSYTTPGSANSAGSCGNVGATPRTILVCDLEAKARALEP